MRVSREKAAEHREQIIDAAGALFRSKGFGGVGVAEIMKAADLTHGGFYGHFASKDDLIAQASERRLPIITLDGSLMQLAESRVAGNVQVQARVEFAVRREQILKGTLSGAATPAGVRPK